MSVALELDGVSAPTTDGEIAIVNLESGCSRSWTRFWQNPLRENAAEIVIEHERLIGQFIGDLSALDRLESLASHLVQVDGGSIRSALANAQVASMAHRFSDARRHLADADRLGAPQSQICRLTLNIDQACGVNGGRVLDQRRAIAERSGRLNDLAPFGALLADLREFAEADDIYRQALRNYQDVSPFPVAWVCFQLGVLWGELVPEPRTTHAAQWYRRAIDVLPRYTKARVHLAEIYASQGRLSDAEALLAVALSSRDPEVRWRLADVMAAQGKTLESEAFLQAARSQFNFLLGRHLLAFADHGAEFYASSGNDCRRALDLARVNIANRPTLRAFEQGYAIAASSADDLAANELLAAAAKQWGDTVAFRRSSLAQRQANRLQGAVA